MSAVPCPNCIDEGVDCPLVVDGECIHCGRRDAPISRRIESPAFRLRFARDSLLWRLRATRSSFRIRTLVSWLLGRSG
jgi:hypothetical protein